MFGRYISNVGLCIDVWLLDELFYSSLPCLLSGYLVCGSSSCDDHRLNWWEQMGEVLVVNKGMVTLLL